MNVVAVSKPMTFKVRTRFRPGGEWCKSASKEELLLAAKDIELDTVGVENKEKELATFLQVATCQQTQGEVMFRRCH